MSERDFCYWLHGYMELTEEFKGLTAEQVKTIEDHLDLVFEKVTPDKEVIKPAGLSPRWPTEQPLDQTYCQATRRLC